MKIKYTVKMIVVYRPPDGWVACVASMSKPAGPLFSTGVGLGNTDVGMPGNLDSTLGIVTGIELAFGLSLLDDVAREFMVLFDETGESSLRALGPSISFGLGRPLASAAVGAKETGV